MAAYRKGDDIIGLEGIRPSVDARYVTYYNTFCIENNVLTYKLYSTYASKFHERTYHLTPSEIVQLKTSPAKAYIKLIVHTLMCYERHIASAHNLIIDIPHAHVDLLAAFRTLSLNHNPGPPFPHPWYKNKNISFASEIKKKPRSG